MVGSVAATAGGKQGDVGTEEQLPLHSVRSSVSDGIRPGDGCSCRRHPDHITYWSVASNGFVSRKLDDVRHSRRSIIDLITLVCACKGWHADGTSDQNHGKDHNEFNQGQAAASAVLPTVLFAKVFHFRLLTSCSPLLQRTPEGSAGNFDRREGQFRCHRRS